MHEKTLCIWGAGRIGRGFIGDLYNEAGYHLVLIEKAQALVDQLKNQGKFSVYRASGESKQRVEISNFTALHTSQEEKIQAAFNECEVLAVSVFPRDFEAVAGRIQAHLLERRNIVGDKTFNILLCTNLIHAGPKFKEYLLAGITENEIQYFEDKVGIIETLVIRICPEPPAEIKEQYPLVVWTNGYAELPIEKNSVKGEMDFLPSMRLVQDMRAEEIRKIYTYNMCHAVLSYHGQFMGYDLLVECLKDESIRAEALGALKEVSRALQNEYGFTVSEMDGWIDGVLTQTNNPTIGDTVFRSAADPIRKLKQDDRLIGPLMLCKKNGVETPHLLRAIAAAFHFDVESDAASLQLQEYIRKHGIRESIFFYSGLSREEKNLVDRIEEAYDSLPLEYAWKKKAEKAYELGFHYEKVYHGCGQCSVAAVTEALDIFDPEVFKAATGLCGGIGLKNDSTCSALIGGAMAIGLCFGRRRDHFDGDREEKYLNFELVQALRERFIEEYGSITCRDIHTKKYGIAYDLSDKNEQTLFEENGGHGDSGCTQVVAKAAKWTVEILADQILKNPEKK
ncbi:MAG: C-GCAxxG-C-C family protein [Anaerolineales bacterium]|nr:C-GCAxxG-C-C family protein [Anaerolineales bacterium]